MSIRVGGTIVIDDSRNFSNVASINATTYTGDGGNLTNISKVDYIKKPIPFSPITGDTGTSMLANLFAAPYLCAYQDDARAFREFQLTTNADTSFSSIQLRANVNLDNYQIVIGSVLNASTTFRWRCRDFSTMPAANILFQSGATANASSFSDVQTFTTASTLIGTPNITSPTEAFATANVGFTASSNAFVVIAGTDTHASSDWQVSALTNFSNTVVSSTANTSALTSYSFGGSLFAIGPTYYMRTRHKGTSGNYSAYSATRSFTRAPPAGQIAYTSAGTYTYTAPPGVTSVSAVGIGGGAGGFSPGGNGPGGGGGALAYRNSIAVTPGGSYTVVVGAAGTQGSWSTGAPAGAGGATTFFTVTAGGGSQAPNSSDSGAGGTPSGPYSGGAPGGASGTGAGTGQGGGGGAGGYSGGGGGAGGNAGGNNGSAGTGGAGGGGGGGPAWGTAGSGGGVGLLGAGTSGTGGPANSTNGGAGSGGSGVTHGGGGAGGGGGSGSGPNGSGGLRIMWPGDVRVFPSTRVADES